MKKLNYFLLLLSALIVETPGDTYGQVQPDSLKPFTLTLTTFNHAERIYAGTSEYTATDTYLKVINYGRFDSKGKTVFSKHLSKKTKSITKIANTKLDSLKGEYINYCVMPSSGREYLLTFKNSTSTKDISLHHYYLKPIAELIELVNDNLPKKYRIPYPSKEINQNCPFD